METSSAMDSASPSMDIKEVKCPICMDYMRSPVTLDCGHNFCKECIIKFCEVWEDLECPICKAKIKRGNFQPNWQLANIVEKVQRKSLDLRKEDLCVRHKERLNLFCKEDQELVCLICERSPEHQSHTVQLLEEAAKEWKDQLCSRLEVLRLERKTILASEAGTKKESQDLLGWIEEKKSRTVAVFNQVHQFLEKQKMVLLSQMEELKEIIITRREEHMARLMKELISLEGLIQQMEEKCQQPASELLQDIGRTLERYEKKEVFQNPVAFPPELTCRIRKVFDVKPLLEGVRNQFPANLTLDPDTANPELFQSKDLKSDLPETIKPEVIWNSQRSHNTYKLCFTRAGSFSCCHTNLKFDAKAAVTITYQLDSWHKYKNECKQRQLLAVGPLFSIQVDSAEAVAAVNFPHFLDLDDKNSPQVQIAHFLEGGIRLEKPDLVEPFYAVLKNPSFSPCGVVFKKSFFKQKVKVHAMALLYQVREVSNPKFHLYLLPNDINLRKAVDEYEEKCPSRRVHKSSGIKKPLTIGSSFTVAKLDNVTVSPKELQLQYLDAEMEQPYLELYVKNMQEELELHVMEKVKDELVWEAYVRQEELKDLGVPQMRGACIPTNVPSTVRIPRREQHFIECHREQLIQRTTNVEGVLDILYGIILDEEQYQRIRAKATRPEKMRELYSLMPGWNNNHKDFLYKAFKITNRLLIEDLEPEATE